MIPGLVSVMMPAYNGERYIREAIESLIAQTYTEWELIVVNDGSTDRTAEIARSVSDPRISVWDQPNGGEGAARNAALGRMKGEFVAFLDVDDLYLPWHLETAIRHLEEAPDYDATYSDGYYINESGVRLQSLASRRLPPTQGMIFEQVALASCMLGPPLCVVLRSGPLVKGDLLFETNIPAGGPDWDFFIRCAETMRFGYIDRPTCLYRLHPANHTTAVADRRAADQAKLRVKAIHLPGFSKCSIRAQTAIFYDLLVNLLLGKPEQQSAVIDGPEFQKLPALEQARLLRLMASKTLLYEPNVKQAADWLRLARSLNPADWRAALLLKAYSVNPAACRAILKIRTAGQADARRIAPFSDVKISPRGV